MVVYLYDKIEKHVNEFVHFTYDGNKLRTYLNNKLVGEYDANIGEVFYVQPNGQKKAPIVTKASLPETRGAKIAWALSFCGEKKLANSYDDFKSKFSELSRSCHNTSYIAVRDVYAMAFQYTEKNKVKPIMAFINNTINSDILMELINDYRIYRELPCPVGFLEIL